MINSQEYNLKMDRFLLFYSIIFCIKQVASSDLEVSTPFGTLKGDDRDWFIAFEGIPYAEPPFGDRRFEPPVPFQSSWKGSRDATQPGNPCYQWSHFLLDTDDKFLGDEDCLFLNVYKPKNLTANQMVPVIFHIHGGAFVFGHGDDWGPKFITTRQMILVNINYRLGPLGFLSSSDALIPGNMGMKDQSTAMKWVKDNIGAFGGDPNRITITGFSAGGASVNLHYMSEWSQDLFQNGISHSGSSLDCWVMQHNTEEKFQTVAKLVGCSNSDRAKIVDCLKSKPAKDIVHTVKDLQPFLYNPYDPFGVVPEPMEQNGIPFISDYPSNYMKAGKLQQKPWLITETKDEGLYPVAEFLRRPEYLPFIDQNWNLVGPNLLHYNRTVPLDKINAVSDMIRQHYIGNSPIDEKSYKRFCDISSNRLFHIGADKTVRMIGKHIPVYMYYYTYKNSYALAEIFSGKVSDLLGVSHGDDVLLVYSAEPALHDLPEGEKSMQTYLLDLYESYTATGVPTFKGVPLTRAIDENVLTYTRIDGPNEVTVKNDDNFGDHKFWDMIDFDEP